MLRRLVALAATVTVALTGLPAPAQAATAACTPAAGSPRCQMWTGKVAWVPDGDTLKISLNGGREWKRTGQGHRNSQCITWTLLLAHPARAYVRRKSHRPRHAGRGACRHAHAYP